MVLVVVYPVVPRAVPPRPRVVGHGELLHCVGVDGSGLVHHDNAAGRLVARLAILAAGKLS